MRSRAAQVTRSGGFTLMEVVVTILIMAGIMVTITQILNAARNSRDRIHNMQEAHLAGPALLDRIESDLRAMHLFNRDQEVYIRVKNRVLAGRDADSLDFVTSTNGLIIERQVSENRFVRADCNEVGFRLRTNPANDEFLELWRREDFGIDDEPLDGGRYSFLHDRVKAFNIEVFEEDGPDGDPLEDWGTDLDEYSGLPARIEIELTIELAPRMIRETLIQTRREVTFRRTWRFPAALHLAQEVNPVPIIPNVPPPVPQTDDPTGADGSTATDDGTVTPGTSTSTSSGPPPVLPFPGG